MKTILVPASGSETDGAVFATALALARSVRGHLQFFHIRLSPAQAVFNDPHAQFCVGPAIARLLTFQEKRDKAAAESAARRYAALCEQHGIPVLEQPSPGHEISAEWLEETDDPEERLLFHARHSDVTVLGRRHAMDYMPPDLLVRTLTECGRPVVIAPDGCASATLRTIVIGWKEAPECARVLTAALPLLSQAKRVVLVTVGRDSSASESMLTHLSRQLEWNGVAAEARALPDHERRIPLHLTDACRETSADLLVMGGFGHKVFREQLFGGVTQELVESARVPVLMMH